MPDTTLDPQAIAKAVAIEVADEDNQVGDFVEAIDLGDDVTDFRFETRVRGYEVGDAVPRRGTRSLDGQRIIVGADG